MGKECMKCGASSKNLIYIREWRAKGHHWVCERCERQHARQRPEFMVPFEISKHNKALR